MDVSQILSNLFVGSFPRSTEDIDRLRRDFGITAVLNVQTDDDMAHWGVDWRRLESCYREAGVEARRVPVRDFDKDNFRHQLPKCVEVLDELLRQGHVVYVHCNMGVNRSPSIAIAYLHWVLGWTLDKAADHVMECRSCDPYLDAIRLAGEDRKRKE
jgi:protein-tyrosine phosphatase